MKVGKLDSELLKRIVFNNIKFHRDEVMVRPGIGEDCAVIDYGEYACIISTDPITGASNEVGKLAVHITCNDIASNGVEPLGIMMTILAPEGTTEKEIEDIMKQAGHEAEKLNVEIIGGHTEITKAVNRIVISSTAIGKQLKENVVKSSGGQIGDMIIMSKTAGLEGTGIIAYDLEEKLLSTFSREIIEKAQQMVENISVVKEGVIGGKIGTSSMHDVTEGGILGAVWEVCEATGLGCNIYREKIPIAEETEKICSYFSIDPLKLISSGSMLMTIRKEKSQELLEELRKSGIDGSIIGEVTKKGRYIIEKGIKGEIVPPESDELYKVI